MKNGTLSLTRCEHIGIRGVADATGNWSNFSSLDFVTPSNSLDQPRRSNAANEIVQIARTVGANAFTPSYDRNGNMTDVPYSLYPGLSPAVGYAATYDAWNRLTALAIIGLYNVATYSYDGLNRRTVANTYDPTDGSLLETRYFFYSDQWQVIEERVEGATYTPDRQFVWGIRYIDDLILRDRSLSGILGTRLYALQDANWNVVALINTSGVVQQRFCYTPYGVPSFLTPSFTAGTNDFAWETLFCGYRYEIATGMYQDRERYLQPPLGFWLTPDPLRFVDGYNPYEYVRSNPTNVTDPTGEQGVTSVDASINACIKLPTAAALHCLKALLEAGLDKEKIKPLIAALQKVATCEGIHATYSAIEKGTCGCNNAMSKAELLAASACAAASVAGRLQYINLKCDYILLGSINAGSAIKEAAHKAELASRSAAAANCVAIITAKNFGASNLDCGQSYCSRTC